MRRGLGLMCGQDTDVLLLLAFKPDVARTGRVDCVIAAQPNVLSRTVLGAALADDDRSCIHPLPTKTLHPQPFAPAIVDILSRASARLMSHRYPLYL